MEELKKSTIVAIWFMALTFPFVGVKVDIHESLITWRFLNVVYMGVGVFFVSWLWRFALHQKDLRKGKAKTAVSGGINEWKDRLFHDSKVYKPALLVVVLFCMAFPFITTSYHVSILTTALMYVVLGLGLNIVVGMAGLLDLGYVAFYLVGAYSYALLNIHFGLGFWAVIPIGALFAAIFGMTLGFPVLRLRGDYLAIVTLGFGEIIRMIMENWDEFTNGPAGIANIPKPTVFGLDLNFEQMTTFLYFVIFVMVIFTIFVIMRLNRSRIGRAWVALREDEIACEAMGIDTTKTKLLAFGTGACWAGMVGVFFATKTSFVDPKSFAFMQSALILCIVVLGGMGSVVGAVVAALFLFLLPEYLRAFSEYRMLIFGGVMIVMMVFKPEGLIANVRRRYELSEEPEN